MNKLLALILMISSTTAFAEMTNEGWYQEGTNDGCSSGNNRFKKDVKAYIEQAYYKAGYDDGFMKCKRERDYLDSIINDAVNSSVYGNGSRW